MKGPAILLAITFGLAGAVAASNPIEGAFGQVLGRRLPATSEVLFEVKGEPCYTFNPNPASPYFKSYCVLIGPVTRAVHTIRAGRWIGDATLLENVYACRDGAEAVGALLELKYGPKHPRSEFDQTLVMNRSRYARVTCVEESYDFELVLDYGDLDLQALAQQEKRALELRSKAGDPSGL